LGSDVGSTAFNTITKREAVLNDISGMHKPKSTAVMMVDYLKSFHVC